MGHKAGILTKSSIVKSVPDDDCASAVTTSTNTIRPDLNESVPTSRPPNESMDTELHRWLDKEAKELAQGSETSVLAIGPRAFTVLLESPEAHKQTFMALFKKSR